MVHEARKLSDGTGLVFPSGTGRPIADATLSKLLDKLPFDCVPHGFRSSFRDWCGETGVPRELAEGSIAHSIGTPAELAYIRERFLEQRRPVMENWGAYLVERADALGLDIVFSFDEF